MFLIKEVNKSSVVYATKTFCHLSLTSKSRPIKSPTNFLTVKAAKEFHSWTVY
jgi:hypothetical protein